MFFLSPSPEYPRRKIEYVFKVIYQLTTCFHVISLVIIATDFYLRLDGSLPNYFSHTVLKAHSSIAMVMEGCIYRGKLKNGFASGEAEVTLDGVTMGLLGIAKEVSFICFLQLLQTLNCIISSLSYSLYKRHLRVFGVHVPFYHILVLTTYAYSLSIIICVCLCDRERGFYRDAISYCAAQIRRKDPTQLLISEYDEYNITTTLIFWPLAACCFGLVVSFVSICILIHSSLDKATLLHSQADAPWESHTPFCTTKKSVLRLHTVQRNAILKDARTVMREGLKVRIVRSYQLMSDSDFEALVQAMRDQVTHALKQKQFENLKEYFGDHESQIENTGLLWGQNPNWSPPLSSSNIEQANYFHGLEGLPENAKAEHSNSSPAEGFDAYDDHNHSRLENAHNADSLSPSENYRGHLNLYEGDKHRHYDTTAVSIGINDSIGGPSELAQPYVWDEHLSRMPSSGRQSFHSRNLPSQNRRNAVTNDLMEGDPRGELNARIPSHRNMKVPTAGVDVDNVLHNRPPGVNPPFSGPNPTDGSGRRSQLKRKPSKQATVEDEVIPADELSGSSDRFFKENPPSGKSRTKNL